MYEGGKNGELVSNRYKFALLKMKKLWQKTDVMVVPLITTINYLCGINASELSIRTR